MTEAARMLDAWDSFYVILGSAAGALIGLQFVVMTLIASLRTRTSRESIAAFGTPTVVHLTGTLLVSALLSVPWPSLPPASAALGACGLGGVLYSVVVVRRARRQTVYTPVWQDWLWYALLPGTAYATLALAAPFLRAGHDRAPFVVAASALALLLIGIHNAWDTVTHMIASSAVRDRDG
jgi:hypothetical protein